MTLSFRRRLTVALTLSALVFASLIGYQPQAFGAQKVANSTVVSHNPFCNSAFGERACFTAVSNGMYVKLSGLLQKGANIVTVDIHGTWTDFIATRVFTEPMKASYNLFYPIKKMDEYIVEIGFTNPKGGKGKGFNEPMIVPENGMSNLAVTSTALPPATAGRAYHFRFSVHGGVGPYTWYLLYPPFMGMKFSKSGPNAGTLSGTPAGSIERYPVPVIVRDKKGHSAYAYLKLVIN